MVTRCHKCKKTLGFFAEKKECSEIDCNKVFCTNCAKTELKECPGCDPDEGYTYCDEHLKEHNCENDYEAPEEEPEDEEEEEDEDEEESSDEDPYESLTIGVSDDKKYCVLTYNDPDEIELANFLSECESDKYKIILTDTTQSLIVFRKEEE